MLHRSNATCHQALHGIWFIVEIDGGKVCGHTKEAGHNNAEEYNTHDSNRKTIDTSVDKWERFEERVLDVISNRAIAQIMQLTKMP
jgi:hypothetical protein